MMMADLRPIKPSRVPGVDSDRQRLQPLPHIWSWRGMPRLLSTLNLPQKAIRARHAINNIDDLFDDPADSRSVSERILKWI